ncbi:MAG: hypothetical protein U0525_03135 [Patescibacteria group bacterium]
MLKICIFGPDDEKVTSSLIQAASNAGAGKIGNYSQCAFIIKGTGHWKSEEGSNPTDGKVGEISIEPQVKIEMVCPEDKAKEVELAVRKVHPYEEPEINFIKLSN